MGVAGVKDVFEREERTYVLFARRAQTSRQPRARPYGLLRRGRGPQILFCAVPCQRTQHFSGAATVLSDHPKAQRVVDAVIGRILGVPKPGAHSEAHARAGEIRGILSKHPVQVRVSCAARGSASAMESAFA